MAKPNLSPMAYSFPASVNRGESQCFTLNLLTTVTANPRKKRYFICASPLRGPLTGRWNGGQPGGCASAPTWPSSATGGCRPRSDHPRSATRARRPGWPPAGTCVQAWRTRSRSPDAWPLN